jgi:hypothetical protein
MPIDEKKRLADRLVDNRNGLEHTRQQVERIIEELRAAAGSKQATGSGGATFHGHDIGRNVSE